MVWRANPMSKPIPLHRQPAPSITKLDTGIYTVCWHTSTYENYQSYKDVHTAIAMCNEHTFVYIKTVLDNWRKSRYAALHAAKENGYLIEDSQEQALKIFSKAFNQFTSPNDLHAFTMWWHYEGQRLMKEAMPPASNEQYKYATSVHEKIGTTLATLQQYNNAAM